MKTKAQEIADELETNLLAVANGEMKIGKFPIEPAFRAVAELRRLQTERDTINEMLTNLVNDSRQFS